MEKVSNLRKHIGKLEKSHELLGEATAVLLTAKASKHQFFYLYKRTTDLETILVNGLKLKKGFCTIVLSALKFSMFLSLLLTIARCSFSKKSIWRSSCCCLAYNFFRSDFNFLRLRSRRRYRLVSKGTKSYKRLKRTYSVYFSEPLTIQHFFTKPE